MKIIKILIEDYEFIPEPGLVYRVTGGILDFYVFLGKLTKEFDWFDCPINLLAFKPHPENVIQEYTEVSYH